MFKNLQKSALFPEVECVIILTTRRMKNEFPSSCLIRLIPKHSHSSQYNLTLQHKNRTFTGAVFVNWIYLQPLQEEQLPLQPPVFPFLIARNAIAPQRITPAMMM